MKKRSKEIIISKIREALLIPSKSNQIPDFETEIFSKNDDEQTIRFVEQFKKTGGNFIYCLSESEFKEKFHSIMKSQNWNHIYCSDNTLQKNLFEIEITTLQKDNQFIEQAEVGLTTCEALVTHTGSIVISSAILGGRQLSIFPHIHVVVAYNSQIVESIKDAFNSVKTKYNNQLPSMISLVSGPSRTADIEKTLVMGAHGPKELYLFLIDDFEN